MDLDTLTEAVVESITALSQYYREDPIIRKFFSSDVEIDKLLAATEHLVLNIIHAGKDAEEMALDLVAEYIERGFPYVSVVNCIDKLKNETLHRLLHLSVDERDSIVSIFETIKNYISQGYIIKELTSFDISTLETFSKDKMYVSLVDWFYDFREAILSKNYEHALVLASEPCVFERSFKSLAYKVRCVNFVLCESLERTHREFHNVAKDFAFSMSKGDFVTAYFLLMDLKNRINEFVRNMEKTFVIFRDDAENIFFKFVTNAVKSSGEKTLLIIGFRNLLLLSSVYSKEEIDGVFEQLLCMLEDLVDGRENAVVVKGAGKDIFVLALDPPDKVVPVIKIKLSEFLEEISDRFGDIRPEFVMAGFRLEPYIDVSEDELRKSLYHLKLEAINEGLDEHILGKEKRISLIEKINRKYRDIRLISGILREGKVDLFFQPIFDCESKECEFYCLESLARIVVDGKYVPAGVFIDLIHEMDLVERLDELVAEKLSYYARHISKVTNRVSVNASPRSMRSEVLREKLIKACEDLRGEGVYPVIEITEQSLLENVDIIEELGASCGVRFGVDDFGVGYSSLQLVADVAEKGLLEMLKIDGSLIKRLKESEKVAKIVRIIVNIAEELEVSCVAEFVEDEETFEKLRSMGIRFFQGYYLSLPQHLTSILADRIKSV